ncbi:methyltransferase [Brevundimonas goettingensis]|uniref:Methyltransferase n=1 Tax=Brevundimonas goettingensis TaxID=2774190 RepID=A0A975BZ91_9CAUL|nr:methyltransferase [Brevundimonas goettingensis]QTC90275.1 methyltransferase [Brevundimonas goettingensis]
MIAAIGSRPPADAALLDLLAALKAVRYAFVTPTPATHALVRQRSAAADADILRDVFGWCRPFRLDQLPGTFATLMRTAGVLVEDGGGYRSTVRVSTLADRSFLHSAPTRDNDAVFLGPDSYRFTRFLTSALRRGGSVSRALDLGTGAGAGALTLKAILPDSEVHASDINPAALRFAALNAAAAGLDIRFQQACGLPAAPAMFDLIISNPPYIAGDAGKTYRDGGDDYGTALALDWVRSSVGRLASGGRFILYTGAPVVAGRDIVRDNLTVLSAEQNLRLEYEELDPDVFGSSLRLEAYQSVERIAAVGAILTEP